MKSAARQVELSLLRGLALAARLFLRYLHSQSCVTWRENQSGNIVDDIWFKVGDFLENHLKKKKQKKKRGKKWKRWSRWQSLFYIFRKITDQNERGRLKELALWYTKRRQIEWENSNVVAGWFYFQRTCHSFEFLHLKRPLRFKCLRLELTWNWHQIGLSHSFLHLPQLEMEANGTSILAFRWNLGRRKSTGDDLIGPVKEFKSNASTGQPAPTSRRKRLDKLFDLVSEDKQKLV